jgi:hypothetical protein
VRKVVEFLMPLIENMSKDFRKQFFEKRKEQAVMNGDDVDSPRGVNGET